MVGDSVHWVCLRIHSVWLTNWRTYHQGYPFIDQNGLRESRPIMVNPYFLYPIEMGYSFSLDILSFSFSCSFGERMLFLVMFFFLALCLFWVIKVYWYSEIVVEAYMEYWGS